MSLWYCGYCDATMGPVNPLCCPECNRCLIRVDVGNEQEHEKKVMEAAQAVYPMEYDVHNTLCRMISDRNTVDGKNYNPANYIFIMNAQDWGSILRLIQGSPYTKKLAENENIYGRRRFCDVDVLVRDVARPIMRRILLHEDKLTKGEKT